MKLTKEEIRNLEDILTILKDIDVQKVLTKAVTYILSTADVVEDKNENK
jgi:hypothetical protein